MFKKIKNLFKSKDEKFLENLRKYKKEFIFSYLIPNETCFKFFQEVNWNRMYDDPWEKFSNELSIVEADYAILKMGMEREYTPIILRSLDKNISTRGNNLLKYLYDFRKEVSNKIIPNLEYYFSSWSNLEDERLKRIISIISNMGEYTFEFPKDLKNKIIYLNRKYGYITYKLL